MVWKRLNPSPVCWSRSHYGKYFKSRCMLLYLVSIIHFIKNNPPYFFIDRVNEKEQTNTILQILIQPRCVWSHACVCVCVTLKKKLCWLAFPSFSMDPSTATTRRTLCVSGPGSCPRASSSSGQSTRGGSSTRFEKMVHIYQISCVSKRDYLYKQMTRIPQRISTLLMHFLTTNKCVVYSKLVYIECACLNYILHT